MSEHTGKQGRPDMGLKKKVGIGLGALVAALVVLGAITSLSPPQQAAPAQAPADKPQQPVDVANQCDQSLWNHVYNPKRLQIVDPCKTVSGVIEAIRVEKDGDYHVLLKLDKEYQNIVNSANIKDQKGDLVLEPICQNPVVQQDAIFACQNFIGTVKVPPVGTHVRVTGTYVLDHEHGGWAEIHPVTRIDVLQ